MKKIIILLVSLIPFTSQALVIFQDRISKDDQNKISIAEDFFEADNFSNATPIFESVLAKYPENLYFKFKLGICYLNISGKPEKALEYLALAEKKDKSIPNIDYYLGKAYLLNYKYDDALKSFKKYDDYNHRDDKIQDVDQQIKYCENGKKLILNPAIVTIENLGAPLNTINSEYAPIIAADESFLIFTYRGTRSKGGLQNEKNKPDKNGAYYEDIFISSHIGDHWLTPEPLDELNTNDHDAAIAISVDGQKLFIFKATQKDKGDIYMSHLNGTDWGKPERLNRNINTDFWEGSITMSSDEKTIYFASERPGGFGGRDIYKSEKQADGEWGPAKNLGSSINTEFDEDAPFLHPGGTLLYFSSQGHNSMGGYDIFKMEVVNGKFTKPENIGYPINTSSDDKYYVTSASGKRAYYSSGAADGMGQQDIYSITPGIKDKHIEMAVVEGAILGNEKPIEATIKVTNVDGSKDFGTFKSNSFSGHYLLFPIPRVDYKISFEADGYDTHNEYVSIDSLGKVVEVNQNIHLYSKTFSGERIESKDTMGLISSTLKAEIIKQQKMDEMIAVAHNNEVVKPQAVDTIIAAKSIVEDTSKVISETNDSKNSIAAENKTNTATEDRVAQTTQTVEAPIAEKQSENKTSEAEPNKTTVVEKQAAIVPVKEEISKPIAIEKQTESTPIETVSNKTIASEKQPENKIVEPIQNAIAVADIKSYFESKSLKDASIYNQLIQSAGKITNAGVAYKVQIGAYRKPWNFKYKKQRQFGTADTLRLEDGITRFTMNTFTTLQEAETFRQRVIATGVKDAWITAIINGERKMLMDLIKVNFDTKVMN